MNEKSLKTAGAGLAALMLMMAGMPAQADAQMSDFGPDSRFVIEVRGGGAFPLSDLGDVQDPGYTVGAGLGYQVNERITLRADGELSVLSAADVPAGGLELPDMRLWHYTGGAEVAVLPAGNSPLSVSVNVGAGATTFDTDQFGEIVINPVTENSEADFNEVYFTANGGLKVAYSVSPRVDVFAGGQAYLSFADEEDTAVFSEFTPDAPADGFDTVWSVPVHGGFRVHF